MVILLINLFQQGTRSKTELTFSEFLRKLDGGQVKEVTIRGERLTGKLSAQQNGAGDFFVNVPPNYDDLVQRLYSEKVEIDAEPQRENPLLTILFTWGPILLIIGLWIFFMRQMQTGGNRALSFGKSKARLLVELGQEGHLQGRRRRRRGEGRAVRDRRVPEGPAEVPEARRQDPQGRPSDGPSRHRQDAARARDRGRGQRAVLLDLRLGLRRDVRRRRRRAACATSSSRARRTRPASSSSTRSTPSAAIAAPAWAAATTSASRRSTSSWSRWTASRPTRA